MRWIINTEKAMEKHVKEVMKLKKYASFDEVSQYIRPYLVEGDVYEKTFDELYNEWIDVMEPDECLEFCKETQPELPTNVWMDLTMVYILDWGEEYWSIDSWDYVTKEMMERWRLRMPLLQKTAMENLEKGKNIIYRRLGYDEIEIDTPVYLLQYKTHLMPSYGASAVLSGKARKALLKLMKEPYYILLFDRRAVFMVPVSAVDRKEDIRKVKDSVMKSRLYSGDFLTDRVFKYDGERLMEIVIN